MYFAELCQKQLNQNLKNVPQFCCCSPRPSLSLFLLRWPITRSCPAGLGALKRAERRACKRRPLLRGAPPRWRRGAPGPTHTHTPAEGCNPVLAGRGSCSAALRHLLRGGAWRGVALGADVPRCSGRPPRRGARDYRLLLSHQRPDRDEGLDGLREGSATLSRPLSARPARGPGRPAGGRVRG